MEAVRKLAKAQGYETFVAACSDEQLLSFIRMMIGYRGQNDTRSRVLKAARELASSFGVNLDTEFFPSEQDAIWRAISGR